MREYDVLDITLNCSYKNGSKKKNYFSTQYYHAVIRIVIVMKIIFNVNAYRLTSHVLSPMVVTIWRWTILTVASTYHGLGRIILLLGNNNNVEMSQCHSGFSSITDRFNFFFFVILSIVILKKCRYLPMFSLLYFYYHYELRFILF